MEINQNQNQEHKKATIEELLKLKRLEKPSEAFWNRFDRELQEKTWSALAAKVTLGERIQRIWRTALMPVATASLFVLGFFFYEEIGKSLNSQSVTVEDTKLVAMSEASPVVEEGISLETKRMEALLGIKNYLKKELSLEEETSEGRRVFTHRSLYANPKNGAVHYVVASPYTLGTVSNKNLIL